MLSWSLDRLADERPLTEHDVARAHIAAPHVLAAWEARDAEHWRRVFLSLLIGAAVPVLGCSVLGWTPLALMLAVTLDVFVLVLCDALKFVLAARRAEEERAHQDEAADVLAVIAALRRPRRPRYPDLRGGSSAPQFYLGLTQPGLEMPWQRWAGTLLVGVLVALFLVGIGQLFPELLPWFLAGALIRAGSSAVRTLRAGQESAWRSELLPESTTPMLALGVLALFGALAFQIAEDQFRTLDPQWLGFAFLCLYLVVAAALSRAGLHHVQSAAASMRGFIARDREQLKQRVRQING